MMKNFKSSPLWLIGLFILFAEGTAGFAAVNIDGWPQAALVLFVIFYATVVTAGFFAFLWYKPENFYGPMEYGDISPELYARALKGLPKEMADAVTRFETNPFDKDAFFSLVDNLLNEEAKQHIVLMHQLDNRLDVSNIDENGFSHHYDIITRNKGIIVGVFSPKNFLKNLKGTELVSVTGGQDKIMLTERGKLFAIWLKEHEKDAETFNSDQGRWGKEQSVSDALNDRLSNKNV